MFILLNGFFWLTLAGTLTNYLLGTLAAILNLVRLKAPLPEILRDVYSSGEDNRSREYARARLWLEIAESTCSVAIFIGFWLMGGFGRLDDLVRGWVTSEIPQAMVFLAFLGLGAAVLDLPFRFISTFRIEQRFGFNRMTLRTFISDGLKGLFLAGILLVPVGWLLLWMIQHLGPGSWWLCWALTTLFSLTVSYAAPRWILPMFHHFSPLPDGELGRALRDYANKMHFQIADLSVIDGSRRSSKANAFFTGFGKNKRIALFDTLIEKHDTKELVAVLAHEVGHERLHHLWKMLAVGILQTGLFFFMASKLLSVLSAAQALGFSRASLQSSLLAAVLLWKLPSLLFGLASQVQSRRHEFAADRFAAETTGDGSPLSRALRKLSGNNLGNPVPHSFYVWLNYTHPPLANRLEALAANGLSPGTQTSS